MSAPYPPSAVVPLLSRGVWIGADASMVSEIVGARSARRLAGSNAAVIGVIAWRGRAVSLVDITALLSADAPPPGAQASPEPRAAEEPRRIVIVSSGPSLFGLAADAVREVQPLDEASLTPPDASAHAHAHHRLAPRRALLLDDRHDRERWARGARHKRSLSEPPSSRRIPVLLLDIEAIAGALAAGALMLLLAGCQADHEPKGSPAPAAASARTSSGAATTTATAATKPADPASSALSDSIFEGLPARTVAGRIVDAKGQPLRDVIVYIKGAIAGDKAAPKESAAVLDQKDKTFLPRVLPVVVGTRLTVKNSDQVLHNAYSRSKAKAFDLGAFSSRDTKSIDLDTPGRVDIFCAIHTNMHSIVLVLENPYFAVTDAQGAFRIAKTPAGKRTLTIWHEVHGEEDVPIEIPEDRPLVIKRSVQLE